jgi:transposase
LIARRGRNSSSMFRIATLASVSTATIAPEVWADSLTRAMRIPVVPDFLLVGETLDAQQVHPPAGLTATKRVVCLDRGYRQHAVIEMCDSFGVTPIVKPPRGSHSPCTQPHPARQTLVVERTFSWLNRYRRLLIRWEKKSENYLAFLHLACAIITYLATQFQRRRRANQPSRSRERGSPAGRNVGGADHAMRAEADITSSPHRPTTAGSGLAGTLSRLPEFGDP